MRLRSLVPALLLATACTPRVWVLRTPTPRAARAPFKFDVLIESTTMHVGDTVDVLSVATEGGKPITPDAVWTLSNPALGRLLVVPDRPQLRRFVATATGTQMVSLVQTFPEGSLLRQTKSIEIK